MEPVVSDAKVVYASQNLERVIKETLERLGDTLEYAPPRRFGRYEIQIRVSIAEFGRRNREKAKFEHFEHVTRRVTTRKGVRR